MIFTIITIEDTSKQKIMYMKKVIQHDLYPNHNTHNTSQAIVTLYLYFCFPLAPVHDSISDVPL